MNENQKENKLQPTEAEPPVTGQETAAKETPAETRVSADSPTRVRKARGVNNKKRLLAIIISVVLVVAILVTVLVVNLVRKNRPPALEEVRDRVIALIDASFEINEILFGKGLPTYPRIYQFSDYTTVDYKGTDKILYYFIFEDETHGTVIGYQYYVREIKDGEQVYTFVDLEKGGELTGDFVSYRFAKRVNEQTKGEGAIWHSDEGNYSYYPIAYDDSTLFFYETDADPYYDFVRTDCGYLMVEDIKDKAAAVYSASYLSSVNESVFTGITVSDRDSGTLYPLYMNETDDDGILHLKKYNQYKGLELGRRLYDYSTMRIDKGDSKADYVVLEIESWLEGKESERTVVRVALALENGEWFLDSPTY